MGSIEHIISNIVKLILDPIVYILILISIMYFFWGITIYIFNGDDQKERQTGKDHMIWGTAGLLIIFSVMGIINLINSSIRLFF